MDEFKLIVAGGRDYADYAHLCRVLDVGRASVLRGYTVAVVCGLARGADALGRRYALEHGLRVYEFPADWNGLGKRAGYVRNEQMADAADGLLAFWDGQSRGTANMIASMRRRGKPVKLAMYTPR